MSNNCFVTTFKGTVNDFTLPFLNHHNICVEVPNSANVALFAGKPYNATALARNCIISKASGTFRDYSVTLNNAASSNNYITSYIDNAGDYYIAFPQDFPTYLYFKFVKVSGEGDINNWCVNLKKCNFTKGTPLDTLIIDRAKGDISSLAKLVNLVELNINSPLAGIETSGNVEILGSLTKLTKLYMGAKTGVGGDVVDMLDGMVANGRTPSSDEVLQITIDRRAADYCPNISVGNYSLAAGSFYYFKATFNSSVSGGYTLVQANNQFNPI